MKASSKTGTPTNHSKEPDEEDTVTTATTFYDSSQLLFGTSKLTWIVVFVRLLILLGAIPSDITHWMLSSRNSAVSSLIQDPIWTLSHVHEARGVQTIFDITVNNQCPNHGFLSVLEEDSSYYYAAETLQTAAHCFAQSYAIESIHLPPLLLAMLDTLLHWIHQQAVSLNLFARISPAFLERFVLGILLLVVDFMVSLCLERIGSNLLLQNDTDDMDGAASYEEMVQEVMPEQIQPKLAHIFPVYQTTYQDPSSGCDNEDSEQDNIAPISPKNPLIQLDKLPLIAAQLYFVSPAVVLSSSGMVCFQNLSVLAWTWALSRVTSQQQQEEQPFVVATAFGLAASAYLQLHNILLVIPAVCYIQQTKAEQGETSTSLRFGMVFMVFFLWLHLLSYLLVSSSVTSFASILKCTTLFSFTLRNDSLAPSLSTLWYLSMQLFDRFRIYFSILITTTPYLLVIPMTIRLYQYPTVLVTLFWMFQVLFRPPHTLYHLTVMICWMLYCPRSLARMRAPLVTICVCALPIPVVLYTVNHWLWLETGTGEANFCYFQCLAYNVFVALIVMEFCGASLRRDKALRVTEKIQREQESSASPSCDS